METLKENIDKQIEYNQNKNIFIDNLDIFQFATETIKAISNASKLNSDSKQLLIEYATDKALQEFYKVNQYYSFDLKAKHDLRIIYSELFENFCAQSIAIEDIAKNHYQKLKC